MPYRSVYICKDSQLLWCPFLLDWHFPGHLMPELAALKSRACSFQHPSLAYSWHAPCTKVYAPSRPMWIAHALIQLAMIKMAYCHWNMSAVSFLFLHLLCLVRGWRNKAVFCILDAGHNFVSSGYPTLRLAAESVHPGNYGGELAHGTDVLNFRVCWSNVMVFSWLQSQRTYVQYHDTKKQNGWQVPFKHV